MAGPFVIDTDENVVDLSGVAAPAHAASHTDGSDDIQDATLTQKGLMTIAAFSKLNGIEALADVTDATNVDAAGAVMEADFNAQTVLVAVSDDSPSPQVVGDSEFVGRPSGGNVGVMTAAQARTVLNVEDGADVTDATNVDAAGAVMETDYNAQTVIVAVSDDTPIVQVVGDSEFVGRPSGGNVGVMTAAQGRTVLNVEDGADVTDATNVAAAGAPVWQKYTVPESSFTAAAGSEDVELFSLVAGGIIHAVKIKHSAAFTGGTLSAFTVSVGITGNLAKYAGAFDVFQAPGNTVQQLSSTVGTENHGAATSIRIEATATGDTVNNALTGSVDVWVLVSVAV